MPFGDVSLDAPSFPSKTITSAKGRVTADRAAGGISTFQVKHWGSPSKIWAVDAKHFARFKQSFHQNSPTTKKLHPPPPKKKTNNCFKVDGWYPSLSQTPNTKNHTLEGIPSMIFHPCFYTTCMDTTHGSATLTWLHQRFLHGKSVHKGGRNVVGTWHPPKKSWETQATRITWNMVSWLESIGILMIALVPI